MKRGHLRTSLTLAGSILLAGITFLAILALDKQADENRQVEAQLAEIETNVQRIDALDWEAIAEREVNPQVERKLAEARSQILVAVPSLEARYPKTTVVSSFYHTYVQYMGAVDEEFRWLRAGDVEQAQKMDEIRVDPSFNELMGKLGQARSAFERTAEQALHREEIWELVVIFSSTAAFLGLFWQYQRARQRTQLAVTEQETLRSSEERFRELTEKATDLVLIVTADRLLSYLSPSATTILGYEYLDGRTSLLDFVDPADAKALAAWLDSSRPGQESALLEFRMRRQDGSWIWMEGALRNLLSDPKIGGLVINARNVSERKEVEAEMQRARAAAEAASRAKSDFLANMSHEIRTPMNGVIGLTELALETELNLEQREYLTSVKASADSLLTVINDILDFSKIEAGKLELDPTEFDLRDNVGDTGKALAHRAQEKGLELIVDVQSDVPGTLIGDPARLRQVLVNLLGNAVKFTRHGEVVLRVKTEARTETTIDLHFSIADTGIGIPAERQKAIFEAFAQADNSTTRRYGGTGLGLTISSHLVAMMSGRLWVESEADKGSTFHFTASFGLGKSPAGKVEVSRLTDLRDLRVLVVDDNATNRRILEEQLIGWRMKPMLATGGQEALVAMRLAKDAGSPFPLVLTDVRMPEMDGFALAERIKADPLLAGATIMMITVAGQRGDVVRCRQLGVSAYLTKPIKPLDLLDAISTVMGMRSQQVDQPVLVTRHSLREARRIYRVLIAEDNAVNQMLATRLLEKRGHSVVVVNNGREALLTLDKLNWAGFDVVLMDVQMPEMDGFEATAAIRAHEKTTGQHLPIIALTAHAIKGDKERCLAAGMDGYVSKPIKAEELLGALENLARSPQDAEVVATPMPRDQEPIDTALALAHVEGDVELLHELVALFLRNLPEMLTTLQWAVMAGDAKGIERAAHKLKGSVGNFAAQPAFEAVSRLEFLASEGALYATRRAYYKLETEIGRLKSAMAHLSG